MNHIMNQNIAKNRGRSNDTDHMKKDKDACAELLPESSRPHRDGPGGG